MDERMNQYKTWENTTPGCNVATYLLVVEDSRFLSFWTTSLQVSIQCDTTFYKPYPCPASYGIHLNLLRWWFLVT